MHAFIIQVDCTYLSHLHGTCTSNNVINMSMELKCHLQACVLDQQ